MVITGRVDNESRELRLFSYMHPVFYAPFGANPLEISLCAQNSEPLSVVMEVWFFYKGTAA